MLQVKCIVCLAKGMFGLNITIAMGLSKITSNSLIAMAGTEFRIATCVPTSDYT